MGRLSYQPITEENSDLSVHGQLIIDPYTGHISTNHNNVINSATKRIERKLEDVFQLERNIIEQTNVINNLFKDFESFNTIEFSELKVLLDDLLSNLNYLVEINNRLLNINGFEDDDQHGHVEALEVAINDYLLAMETLTGVKYKELEPPDELTKSIIEVGTEISKIIEENIQDNITIKTELANLQILKNKILRG